MPKNQFTSTNQPKRNGRRPNKLKGIITENELSSDDISNLIKALFDKTEDEMKEIGQDKEQPMLIRAFVRAFAEDIQQGKLFNINMLLDRAIGKPMQKQEIAHSVDTTVIDKLRAKYENK